MKLKTIFMASVLAGISFSATAQVTVTETGQAVFGSYIPSTSSLGTSKSDLDPQAAVVLSHPKGQSFATRIAFGLLDRISVGEVPGSKGEFTGQLHLKGYSGLAGTVGGYTIR